MVKKNKIKIKGKSVKAESNKFKNKILFVTEELFPRDKGGIGKLLYDVAKSYPRGLIYIFALRDDYNFGI